MSADFNFNFRGAPDPLLSSTSDYAAQYSALEVAQRDLEQRRQALLQLKQKAESAPQGSVTPIWDEIDAITASMAEPEFALMQQDETYQSTLRALMEYVSAVQLRAIRPQIEQSAEGKQLLEQHLATVKHLRKSASAEMDRKLADFEDYTKNYAHLSYADYLKTKGGNKK